MAEQGQVNGHSSHRVKSLQQTLTTTPAPDSTLFHKSGPIITPKFLFLFFFSAVECYKVKETELDGGGCTWKINLAPHTLFQTAGSQVRLHTCRAASAGGRLELHYPSSVFILHPAGRSPCRPVTDCTLNQTWQQSHSPTKKQIPTAYTKTALHLHEIVSRTD